jgi:pyruvate/2-oxoglutarate dehydrogenase complex dihydrolipoamide acyltransferase (E2) component
LAIINAPQAATRAIGTVKQKPFVRDSGAIVARAMITVPLIRDHRIVYEPTVRGLLSRLTAAPRAAVVAYAVMVTGSRYSLTARATR